MPRKHWQSRGESSRRAMKTELILLALDSLTIAQRVEACRYTIDRASLCVCEWRRENRCGARDKRRQFETEG